MGRKLVSSRDAIQAPCQHTVPCTDCPWARKSLVGWLGPNDAEEWVQIAHSDAKVPCHVIDNQQCAGIAIYRKNVCKTPRDPEVLRLPADRETVFATPAEFKAHHEKLRK
jgi:hypothetical protein